MTNGTVDKATRHAIVIGAGIAGLLTARVLSKHFARVTVLDRDALPTQPVPRDGVPQGRHIHVLLPGGLAAIERLLPGATQDLILGGALPWTSTSQSSVWVFENERLIINQRPSGEIPTPSGDSPSAITPAGLRLRKSIITNWLLG